MIINSVKTDNLSIQIPISVNKVSCDDHATSSCNEVQISVVKDTLYLFPANKLFNLVFSFKYILRASLVMVLRDGRRYLGAATLQKCLKPAFSTTEKGNSSRTIIFMVARLQAS